MKTSSYNENNINLLVLERWLETKIQETFNPLASIIYHHHTTTCIYYILAIKWWKYPEYCEMLVMFGRSQNFRL